MSNIFICPECGISEKARANKKYCKVCASKIQDQKDNEYRKRKYTETKKIKYPCFSCGHPKKKCICEELQKKYG